MSHMQSVEVSFFLNPEFFYFDGDKPGLLVDVGLFPEISEFDPLRDYTDIDILIFVFVLFDFGPVVVFADVVHLFQVIA